MDTTTPQQFQQFFGGLMIKAGSVANIPPRRKDFN